MAGWTLVYGDAVSTLHAPPNTDSGTVSSEPVAKCRVVFCWPQFSGYMAACWRRLAAESGVEAFVLTFAPGGGEDAPFQAEVMQGIPHRVLNTEERNDERLIQRLVVEQKPDLLVLSGWFHEPYRRLIDVPELARCRFVMGMDNPWLGRPRQHLGRLRHRRFRARMDAVVVPGERGFQFARRLGFEASDIHRGLYAVEEERLTEADRERRSKPSGAWPEAFLFVGRYVEAKGLDTLVEGYRRYRAASTAPWELRCCGTGSLAHLLEGEAGIRDLGFAQPAEIPGQFRDAGCFVLASRYDPWPLVVVEAAMAGLPLLCSDSCGSAVELLRPYHNGFFFGTDDAGSLARQMARIEGLSNSLATLGSNSRALASAYTPKRWVERWLGVMADVLGDG